MSKIVVDWRTMESEMLVARMCAELVRQGITFDCYLVTGCAGKQYEITFTGGY
jgi:hypothetical protein